MPQKVISIFIIATDAIIIGWIMHKYSKYAGFPMGQAGKVTA
jgi:hypothetical protein